MVRRRRELVRGLTALGVALVVVASSATPVGAQTAPFLTGPAVVGWDGGGTSDEVVIVGDDNLITLGPSVEAIWSRILTGSDSYVSANTGASWVTYGSATQVNGNGTLPDLTAFFGARIAVGALGLNDARIMTQSPAQYDAADFGWALAITVATTLLYTDCVLLVNVQPRLGDPNVSVAAVDAVNLKIQQIVAAEPGRVFLADWKTYSAGQTTWFQPSSNQVTHLGSGAYGEFVANEAADVASIWGC
jgi:hypothetical protein